MSVSNCSLWWDVRTSPSTLAFHTKTFVPQQNLRRTALSAHRRLLSDSAFSICLLQLVSADLCNLWHAPCMHCARLRAEVTGCDNFCLADNHRQNHAKPPFLASQWNVLWGAGVLLRALPLREAERKTTAKRCFHSQL